ncbi:glycosyltransferase [Candidatus Micrarchaeota archaeon]|nr:glycosyltransferase [Candidatus Micrarchaeota archaeon]
MKLCVFPGDSMRTFYEKGELKPRYYNPENIFDEVHFITFAGKEIEPEKIKAVVGNAKPFIHNLGPLKPWSLWTKRARVLEEIKKISPDVIRAFTPALHGYFAAFAAKKLNIPFVISLHGDFDRDARYFYWKMHQWKNWLQSTFMKLFTERFAISSADRVICAYSFPVRYAREYGAKNVTVIYNKVYAERFAQAKPALKLDKPAVICVGRLIPEKNQQCLIRAMENVDARLILIGNGPEYGNLVALADELGVKNKVLFFKSVPNVQIAGYYKSASVFALPIKYGGIAIPVIEAMAAGLPVVVARPELDPHPEFASEVGFVIENTPEAFAEKINLLLKDKKLREKLGRKGREKFAEIEGLKMEAKEAAVYKKLV